MELSGAKQCQALRPFSDGDKTDPFKQTMPWPAEIPAVPYLGLSALWAAHTATLVAYFNLDDTDVPLITQLEVCSKVGWLGCKSDHGPV